MKSFDELLKVFCLTLQLSFPKSHGKEFDSAGPIVCLPGGDDELSSSGELGEESSNFDMGVREKRIDVRLRKIFLI